MTDRQTELPDMASRPAMYSIYLLLFWFRLKVIGLNLDGECTQSWFHHKYIVTLSRDKCDIFIFPQAWCPWATYFMYRKFPKFSDTWKIGCNHSKIRTKRLNHSVMHPNGEDRMANSVDPDQTAPLGAVWSGSALFAQTYPSENLWSLRYIWKILTPKNCCNYPKICTL